MQDVQSTTISIESTSRPPIPSGTQGHFLLHFYAVIARILARLEGAEGSEQNGMYADRFPFLATYRSILRAYIPGKMPLSEQVVWWDAQIAAFEAQAHEHLPLR